MTAPRIAVNSATNGPLLGFAADGKPPGTQTNERGEVSTGLFRKIDTDGLAVLEIENTAIAAPRAKRMSESVPLLGEHIDAGTDLSRLRRLADAAHIPYQPRWDAGAVAL